MIKLKMYGNHKKGDFYIYFTDANQRYMINELRLNTGNRTFDFDRFLAQLNDSIPLEVTIRQKVETLRNNRDVIRRVGIDDADKTVFIGVKKLTKGAPQDKTLRKLYMYTEESEDVITDFIRRLKQANMTVAWTTEEQRYRVADINAIINGLQ